MNILFHVGVGNHDRPERWNGICWIYTQLAKSLEALGHTCTLYVHPAAMRHDVFHRHWTSKEINLPKTVINQFDCCFTWNGISEGDQKIVEAFDKQIIVYGELGFFDHYSTCYFDFSGTNCKSQNLIDPLKEGDINQYNGLRCRYELEPLQSGRYVFVALQDELDTQITKYSPFKTMNEIVQYACDITKCYGDEIKILYKPHPRSPCKIEVKDSRLIEVKENVHHYLKDAELVIGANSSVLFETLLYHNRILTLGLGLTSRMIGNDSNGQAERIKYVLHCYNKQINQAHLGDPGYIKKTWMYKTLMDKGKEII